VSFVSEESVSIALRSRVQVATCKQNGTANVIPSVAERGPLFISSASVQLARGIAFVLGAAKTVGVAATGQSRAQQQHRSTVERMV